MQIVFWLLAACWTTYTLTRLLLADEVPRLPPAGSFGDDLPTPRVSVIISARDEEARIEQTVRRLLDQQGVNLELLLVDDRSTDETPTILRALSEEDQRLEVIRVDDLPDDWLGKPHALHLAAQRATGDWLLFSDADVWMKRDVVARSIHEANRLGADHYTMFPAEHEPTFAAQAAAAFLVASFSSVTARVNRDKKGAFVGIGAFNLVRAEAYRKVGGHEPLRYEVIDDAKLGLLLKRGGFRSRIGDGTDDVEVAWASDLPALIGVLEKNFFAMFNFSIPAATLAFLSLALFWGTSLAAPFVGGLAGLATGAAMLTTIVPSLMVIRRVGWNPLAALFSPLTVSVLLAAIAHSTFTTVKQGGVHWRGTFYPLKRLRRGMLRWGVRDMF